MRQVWVLAVVWMLAACAPAPTPTAAPTQTLIPPTATALGPDVVTPSPTPEVLIPADAQALVSLAVQDLAASLDVAPDAVLVGALEPAAWANADGCEAATAEPDGYRIVLHVDGDTYAYRAGANDVVAPCDDSLDAGSTPTAAADPLAAELLLMAQQRLADDLDLSTRRIRVVNLTPVTWTDTSLNCPSPDTAYEPGEIPGYRLVLAAGEQEYIFHADFERLILCPPGQETLPEATPEA